MRKPSPWIAVGAVAAFNLIQNFLVPPRVYVAANLGAGAGLIYLARKQGCSWDDLGFNPTGWRKSLAMSGAAGALAVGAAAVTSSNSDLQRFLLDERAQSQSRNNVIYRSLLRFPIGTALFEEVAFRGVVYAMWRQAGKSHRTAAAIVAAAFGVWHLIPSRSALRGNPLGEGLTSRVSTMGLVAGGATLTGLSSLGLTWLRRQSGSLIAPWLTHSAVNTIGYLAGVRAWRTSHRLWAGTAAAALALSDSKQ